MKMVVMMTGAAILLGGCASQPIGDLDESFPGARMCEPKDYSKFVGQPASEDMAELIIRDSGAGLFRWLREGGAATTDYRPERVNATIDSRNIITAVRCDAGA